jgi:glyoxylase-like metal-dependent hydrolase (beta-lactamase superfamily II)
VLGPYRDAGYDIPELLVDAVPIVGMAMIGEIEGAPATRILEDGDIVDTGDRAFEVLHLPGHSPGSIGLWEASTGILFSGDAVYDGPLLDELEGSNIDDYVKTMERLRDLPVTVVHGGHEASFDRDRLVEICDDYIGRRAPGSIAGRSLECCDNSRARSRLWLTALERPIPSAEPLGADERSGMAPSWRRCRAPWRSRLRGERLRRRHTAQAGRLHRPRGRSPRRQAHCIPVRLVARAHRRRFPSVVPGLLASVPRSDRRRPRSVATVTVAAWVALLVIVIAGKRPLNALVWRGTDQADPKTVQLAFDINNLSLYALSATAVLLSVLAPMIVIWRWRALPRWLLVLGAAEIIANIVELGGLFSRTGANAAGYGDGVGPFLWVLWVAALSVTILMKETRAGTASA